MRMRVRAMEIGVQTQSGPKSKESEPKSTVDPETGTDRI